MAEENNLLATLVVAKSGTMMKKNCDRKQTIFDKTQVPTEFGMRKTKIIELNKC